MPSHVDPDLYKFIIVSKNRYPVGIFYLCKTVLKNCKLSGTLVIIEYLFCSSPVKGLGSGLDLNFSVPGFRYKSLNSASN